MLISGYGAGTNITTQIRGLQDTMGDLQRQLATGKVARDYAGLGGGRDISLTMRAQLSKSSAYDQTIAFVSGRLEATQLVLGRVEDIMNDTAGGTLEANVQLTSEGQTVQQMLAERRFEETLALLNTEYEDRRIFGGRRSDAQTNIGADAILNGTTGKDGLLQIIDERKLADTNGPEFLPGNVPNPNYSATGRLMVGGTGLDATIAQDATPFGLKIVTDSEKTGATTGIAAGNTPGGDLDFALPAGSDLAPGAWISFEVELPDGTSETIRLEAVADAPDTAYGDPARGYLEVGDSIAVADLPNDVKGFVINDDPALTTAQRRDATAANMRLAIEAALTELAAEQMPNASAKQAADDFFAYDDIDGGDPKRIVTTGAGAYDAYEVLTANPNDPSDPRSRTVLWYTGEVSGDAARKSAIAKIDDSLKVSYGARANEQLFKDVLANLAVFATEEFTEDSHANRERYADLADRVRAGLSNDATQQRSRAVQADFASVQVAVDEARQRHRFRDVLAEDMIDKVEAADDTEVASKLLALQTQLQMSFQTTAMISRLSLVNVL